MQHLFGSAVLGTLSRGQQSLGTHKQPEKLQGRSCFLPTGWEPAPDSQKPLAEEPPAPALPRARGHQDQERSPVTRSAGPRDTDLCSQRSPCCSVPSSPWKCAAFPRCLHPADGGKAAALTMERASRVCWSSGSGSREICTHSGTVTVPPSRSAITTSSWKWQDRHETRPGLLIHPPHRLPPGHGELARG